MTGSFVAHRKCIIAQHIIALAMAELGPHNHNVQCRQFLLELKPKHAAVAGQIKALRVFDHQPFIQTLPRLLEDLFDLSSRMRGRYPGTLKMRRQSYAAETSSPLMQRSL